MINTRSLGSKTRTRSLRFKQITMMRIKRQITRRRSAKRGRRRTRLPSSKQLTMDEMNRLKMLKELPQEERPLLEL